ncbi:MAG TPA: alpha/beta hydrolase [Kofleriaceae bacterium]|nr:alpha/beta hydrolase [Kofleriaceae bacterium]
MTSATALAPGTHRLEVGGAYIVYHVHGRGPVAIAIPGGPGFAWDYLRMPAVEEHLTVVYMEPLGTGDSARLDDPAGYSRARDVADLEALRVHLGAVPVLAIGHSYGGFVALDHAVTHPGALAGLVLYDSSPMTNAEWQADVGQNIAGYQDRAWFADASAAFASIGAATSDAELSALLPRVGPFYVRDHDAAPARWDAYFSRARLSVDRANRGTRMPYDLRDRLPELTIPALVIVGASDFICSPRMAALLASGIPHARLVTLEHSGHFGHLEEPARFADAIATFVRQATASTQSS